jgi:very-short-patch-repair endonuclease
MRTSGHGELDELLSDRDGVVRTAEVLRYLSSATLRWRLTSGRWQQPCRGVVVTQSGPLSARQQLWVALLWGGRGALLAGLTAARLDGLHGFTEPGIHLLVPASRQIRREPLPGPARIPIVVHRSRCLGESDVHPVRLPPRTLLPRSLVDAAAWMATDDRARAVLAAGVQQRLVRPDHLLAVAAGSPRLRRRQLIRTTLGDVAGGAEALSELDLAALIRRFRIPEPDRQASRRDQHGRRRWLDAVWEAARLIVEVDGFWHTEAGAWWSDMQRDNEFTVSGYRVLRFPAFAVRADPDRVAQQILAALRLGTFLP